jgi:hypothetical protein
LQVTDPVLEKRGILTRVHEASHPFLAFIGKNGHENSESGNFQYSTEGSQYV